MERHLETATTATDTTHGHGHGREEYRELIVSTATSDDLGVTFPHINQVGRITRDTILGDGSRRGESVHFITSLTADKATPSHIADLIRNHWRIENTSHWRRDVTLNEDRCRTRTAHSPINLAALRNLTIAIIARHKPARFSRLRNAITGSLPAILATLALGPAVTLGFY